MRYQVATFLAFILAPLFAAAQTTAPSKTPMDQTTPQGTLKMLFLANATSDGDALRSIILADGPRQQHMLTAIADKKAADRDLTRALIAKFPDQWKADPFKANQEQLPPVYDRVDQSQIHISGDNATLSASPDSPPFTLKRSDGKWKIPLGVIVQVADENKLEDSAHQIDLQVKVMRAAATDVQNGKYATQQDAVEDVKKRMFDAAVADHGPTTQP